MTTIHVELPDAIAQEAQRAGLLAPERMEQLLRAQLKVQQIDGLFSTMDRMQAVDDPGAMSAEEVAEEIALMRAERRTNPAH